MEEPVECTITEVCMKEDNEHKLLPVIVTFQNGTLRPEQAHALKCRVIRDKKSWKRTFSVTTGLTNIRYSGSVQNDAKNIGRTMIAIRNRKTNQVRLIEADNVLLSPYIQERKKKKEKSKSIGEDDYSYLQKSFGSKVVKRRAEQKQRLKTDVSLLSEKLIHAVKDVSVELMSSEEPATWFVPCNRDASTVEDVYNLYDFITRDELRSLQDKVKQVVANANTLEKDQYTPFFMEHLPFVLKKREEQEESLAVLLYIDCLMKFFRAPFKPTVLKDTCPYSRLITDKIRNEFTVGSADNKRLRPRKMKDTAVCHMIILSLLILNFNLDLTSMVASAKESILKLQKLGRALGASSLDSSRTKIILKLPLGDPVKSMNEFQKRKEK